MSFVEAACSCRCFTVSYPFEKYRCSQLLFLTERRKGKNQRKGFSNAPNTGVYAGNKRLAVPLGRIEPSDETAGTYYSVGV